MLDDQMIHLVNTYTRRETNGRLGLTVSAELKQAGIPCLFADKTETVSDQNGKQVVARYPMCYFNADPDVAVGDMIGFGSAKYRVVGVNNVQNRNQWWQVRCERIGPND